MRPARSIWRSLLLCALPVAAAAVPAALLVEADSAWYLSLQKPAFNPPPWAYSAAWSLVYLCAAAALYPLLRGGIRPGAGTVAALAAAGALNVVWTGVFFRLHAIGAAAAVLALLLLALISALRGLWRAHRASFALLLPHLLWGLFAFALNWAFLLQNPA